MPSINKKSDLGIGKTTDTLYKAANCLRDVSATGTTSAFHSYFLVLIISISLNLMAIDIFHNMFYNICNIPAKPLPQGMRNMVGIFVLGVE